MKLLCTTAVIAALSSAAFAQERCADGHTLHEGQLTVATGNPAYYPWVLGDMPENGEGFEAALVYALADQMGFAADEVAWTRTSFDEAIQPGAKDFDFNIQQYSITAERDKVVDFSVPYYTSPQAVLTTQAIMDGGAEPTMASLKELKWGVMASTTALGVVMDQIDPEQTPLVYDDNANVTAAIQAGQIDAALFDLPTALYLSAVVVENGAILGQFDPGATDDPDHFGLLMPEGSALKACVDEALEAMRASGQLAEIEKTWLQDATGVPVIQ